MQRAPQLETPFKQQNVLLSQLVTQITSEYESKWLISVHSKDDHLQFSNVDECHSECLGATDTLAAI